MSGDEGKELSSFALEGPDGMANWLRLLGGEASSVAVLSMCLAMAARRGDAPLARRLLALGANPQLAAQPTSSADKEKVEASGGDVYWTTAWSAAVAADSVECLEAMVDAGLDPLLPRAKLADWVDESFSLARIAAGMGAAGCLKRALDWVAEREPLSAAEIMERTWTALLTAKQDAGAEKIEELARTLRSAGGDIDAPVKALWGQTPLEFSAGWSLSATRGILAAGADPRKGNPVQCAVKCKSGNSQDCLEFLLASGLDAENPVGPFGVEFPIAIAVANDEHKKVKMLIAAGASVSVNIDRGSLLAMAISCRAAKCVGVLLAAGLDPDEVIEGKKLAVWAENKFRPGWGMSLPSGVEEVVSEIRAASEAKQIAAASGPSAKRSTSPRI